MSPEVTAAIIAASVGVLTLIGTLAAQYFGRRATSRDTQKTLDRTFVEQRGQLDETLAEQGKQLDRTLAEQRTRTLNERFATAAGQLGDDKPPAVRLAGAYAMAGLVEDWPENRQTCVDVLCGYLRLPYEPDPGEEATAPERLAFRASREVRHTVIRVITAHLKGDTAKSKSWQGLNFDFTGVVFDGGTFSGAEFTGGTVTFSGAEFTVGEVSFGGAKFSGSQVDFNHAKFSGSQVSFMGAEFSDGTVDFTGAAFTRGTVNFAGARFSGRTIVVFHWVVFDGGMVDFTDKFFNSKVQFSGGIIDFSYAKFTGSHVSFRAAGFWGSAVHFNHAKFSDGTVDFAYADFAGGLVSFMGAEFSGGEVSFHGAGFAGGKVRFSDPRDWSFPPEFPWTDTPPPGVELPKKKDQSQA
jgi:uncharacterized protein YjbI with pentapeptide repeats